MPTQKIIHFILLATVFTTGASVLILEVGAVRLLAPYFGSSLYVFSSVLTVVLFALALGYTYGGKLSDQYPYHTPLYFIITLGGLSLLLLSVLALYILPYLAPQLSTLSGPLFLSLFLFFIPALLLGVDSPYVIKLLSKEVTEDKRGEVVGRTFFWSTAGSIVGSISSGFILIPTFGLTNTLIGTSVVLMVLGIGGGILVFRSLTTQPTFDRRNYIQIPKKYFLIFIVLLLLTLYFFFQTLTTEANVVYEDDGFYSRITIYDGIYNGKEARFLRQDSNSSSAMYLESDDLVYPYVQYSLFYKHLIPKPNNFLMLASGAYTIPRAIHLEEPQANIDVVDIEPGLYDLAVAYFRLPTSTKITDHVIDARSYINTSEKKYDYVFIDVFNSGQFVPQHLITREFFTTLKNDVSQDGIVIMNFIGTQPFEATGRTLSGSFTKTVASVFPNYKMYSGRNDNIHQQQNLIYIMRNGDIPLSIPFDATIRIKGKDIEASTLEINPEKIIHSEDIIFTDDFVPSDTLLFKERF